MSRFTHLLGAALIGALGTLLAGAALAQDEVPQTLLNQGTPLEGDQITFCLDRSAPGAPLDQQVGQAIADALLVKAKFVDAPSGFPIDATGYLAELQIAMANTCDVLLGIALQPDFPYPDWATPTRPYAEIPFVLAVTNPSYKRLADIPRDKPLGTALGGLGEYNFVVYNQQQPEAQRWRRFPYADPALMIKRLKDGTIAAALLYQPALVKVTNGDPAAQGIRTVPMDPVPTAVDQVAALVSSRDSFLRSQIDEAIGSLIQDGTIQKLLDSVKFAGKPATE
ncbi:MAG TPA: transporter substrate-binding domain-containing protein [Devosia sp.]|nr:transporter substrate-binding domain-containing protein [Devosia sp.]